MLNPGNKIKVLIIICIHFLCSCENNQSTRIYQSSSDLIGKNEYKRLSNIIHDTVSRWCDSKLAMAQELIYFDYRIDSLICFNKEKNKLICALLIPCTKKNCKGDDLEYLYGVKIKNQWYLIQGPTIFLIRSHYKKDISNALSYEDLHEIALKEIYGGYLKKKDKGFWNNLFGKPEYEINENFFNDLVDDAYNYPFTTQEAWEASYLKLVGENWQKKDTVQRKPPLN